MESKYDSPALQTDMDILSAWETRWDMDSNASKCQVVHVTGSSSMCKVSQVDISSGLTWNSHINHVTANANLTFGFIKTKMPKVRVAAYNSLVRPQLEYALAVWDPHRKVRISQIKQVQRRAARWTASNFNKQSTVTEMVKQLGWRSLEQRRADTRLCLFYKVIHGLVAVPLPDYIHYSNRISRYCHSMTFRQVSTSTVAISSPSFL